MNIIENEIYEKLFKLEKEYGRLTGFVKKNGVMNIIDDMAEMVASTKKGGEMSMRTIDNVEVAYLFIEKSKLIDMSEIAHNANQSAEEIVRRVEEELKNDFDKESRNLIEKLRTTYNKLRTKRLMKEFRELENSSVNNYIELLNKKSDDQ